MFSPSQNLFRLKFGFDWAIFTIRKFYAVWKYISVDQIFEILRFNNVTAFLRLKSSTTTWGHFHPILNINYLMTWLLFKKCKPHSKKIQILVVAATILI